jgi:hypothetical protein
VPVIVVPVIVVPVIIWMPIMTPVVIIGLVEGESPHGGRLQGLHGGCPQ